MKKDGHEHLKGTTSLAMGKLHNKIVGKDFEGNLKLLLFVSILNF